MKIVILTVGIVAIIMTLLPLIPSNWWLFRIFDFPRFQIEVLLIAGFILGLIFLDKTKTTSIVFLILTGSAVIYQAVLIIKYTPVYSKEVIKFSEQDDTNSIALLISNVYMHNTQYEELLTLIQREKPDIVIAVETDKKWMSRLNTIMDEYPNTVHYPLDNTYGILLYSKYKLINPRINFFIEKDIPSIHTKVKLPSGKLVELYALHPEPPVPGESQSSTQRDAELVLVGKKLHKKNTPVIVAGDLNDVAWSHTTRLFQRISGLLDPRVGRGFYNTFNAKYPVFRWPLDHIFHSDDFGLIELKVLPDIGSDHFPVYIKLHLNETAEMLQEEKQPEGDDLKEADKKIRDAK